MWVYLHDVLGKSNAVSASVTIADYDTKELLQTTAATNSNGFG